MKVLIRYRTMKAIQPAVITMFFRQFATLYSAGITLTQCCDLLEKNQSHPRMRLIIYAIKCHLCAGHSLHESLIQHTNIFDTLSCRLVHIGEETGTLEHTLVRLADYHERQTRLKQQLQQALFYPCIVLIIACLMTAGMLMFIIPKFALLLAAHTDKLPFLTRLLFAFSTQLNAHATPLMLLFAISIGTMVYAQQQGYLHDWTTVIWPQLPLIRTFIRTKEQAHFARYLALCLSAGLPITEGLHLIMRNTNTKDLTNALYQLLAQVRAGTPLHCAMASQTIFPTMMVQMSKIGEETGMLDQMLGKCADILEVTLAEMLERGLQLLEPLIMLGLGALIGGLLIAIYLPLFNLGNAF